jgi:hypothetical protein
MHKLSPSLKSIVTTASTTLTLALCLAAGQPAQAEEAVGQMIDDSGLVISSYADGSIREYKLKAGDLACLRIFQQDKSSADRCSVLAGRDLALLAHQ